MRWSQAFDKMKGKERSMLSVAVKLPTIFFFGSVFYDEIMPFLLFWRDTFFYERNVRVSVSFFFGTSFVAAGELRACRTSADIQSGDACGV